MSYSSPSDVRLVISTGLTDSEISSIIEMNDAEIDKRLGSQSTSDKLIKKLSILLTAITIKTRQPESVAIGEYRETHNPTEVWRREAEDIMALYRRPLVKASSYEVIEET